MKSRFLFPHKFRLVGIILLVIGIASILIIYKFSPSSNVSSTSQIISAFSGAFPAVILGLTLIAFSKEKIEDEQIAQLRLDSLQWAIYTNYCILIMCFFLLHGISLLSVVTFNILTPIVFFIVRFRWLIYRLNQSLTEDI
ncbi:hypothetical protein [Mucilaginibacter pineti]|nr:hypothetical protein [Mucilaginibacter pineti]